MRLRCPFLLVLSSLMPLKALSANFEEQADTVITLNELSVSALKSGAMAETSPSAVTIIKQRAINELGLVNIKQASDISPNFYMPEYGSRITSTIYVRGIGSRIEQPVIGINFDNIPILNKNNFDFDIYNLAALEIIRGAQSTLYGRNNMLGTMNLYTISPRNFRGVRGRVFYGSNNTWQASVGWYGKTESGLGIGISAEAGGTSGYWNNTFNDTPVGKELAGSLKTRITWDSSTGWRFDNSLTLNLGRQQGYAYESLESGLIAYDDTCFYKRLGILEGLTLTKDFNSNLKFGSVTSLQYLDDNMTLDQDFMPVDYFTLTQKTREFGWTEDVTFSNRTPISGYNWVAGAMFWMRTGSMHAPVNFKDYGISQLIEHYRNESNPYYPIKWDTRQFLIDTDFKPFSWGTSVYHESKYSTGRWNFTAGLRLDYENTQLDYRSLINTSYTVYKAETGEVYRHANVKIDDNGLLEKSFVELLPKFTVMYRYGSSDSQSLYLNIAKGYKSGGFNTQMFSDVMQQRLRQALGLSMEYNVDEIVSYRPEKAWNYEVGFYSSFHQSKMNLSGSVFYIDCTDQQVTMFPSGTTTGRIMANAGRSRSFGVETSFDWNISPHWLARVSFGWADAKFVDFRNGMADFSGKRIPYAPLTTTFAQITYNTSLKALHLWFDSVEITADFKGTGPIYWNEDNTVRQNWYPILNCALNLKKDKWQIFGRVENVTSTRYSTFYFESIGHRFIQRGLPVRGGIGVAYSL